MHNNPTEPLSLARKTSKIGSATPGTLMRTLVGDANLRSVFASSENQGTEDDAMHTWAETYGVCYEPVSELASLSQAYCSLFWEKTGTWVVVAFKGTDPRSFEECQRLTPTMRLTKFLTRLWLPGYREHRFHGAIRGYFHGNSWVQTW